MEKAYKEGKVRAIGLSNFTTAQIQEILDVCEVKPAILQTEVHPYIQEKELKEFLAKEDMVIQAWYPLGHGDKALTEEEMARIAALNKDKRYYYSTPEMLDGYARMIPPVDEQK